MREQYLQEMEIITDLLEGSGESVVESVNDYFSAEDKMKSLVVTYLKARQSLKDWIDKNKPDDPLAFLSDDPEPKEAKSLRLKKEKAASNAEKFFTKFLAAYIAEPEVGRANFKSAMDGYIVSPKSVEIEKGKKHDTRSALSVAKKIAPNIVKNYRLFD